MLLNTRIGAENDWYAWNPFVSTNCVSTNFVELPCRLSYVDSCYDFVTEIAPEFARIAADSTRTPVATSADASEAALCDSLVMLHGVVFFCF